MNEEIVTSWPQIPLGRLSKKLVNGGTPPTHIQRFWKGETPWITGADFTPAGIGEFRRFVSEEAIAQTATNIIDKGQLLIVTRTGVGKLALAPCNIAISQDITGFYVDEGQATPTFLYYRLQHGLEDLKKLNQGTSINGIVRADLLRYPVELPPIPQQRRIVEMLSTMDETIGQTEALIAKYQQVKAGLMHDLFTRGVTPEGHLRHTRDQVPHLYKESPLGWIPKEWEVSKLREKSTAGKSHIKTGPFGTTLKSEHWVQQGHPVITIGALGEGEILKSELLFVSGPTAQRLREYQLEPGDVVFSRVADVGRSAVISQKHDRWIMSSNLMRISLDRKLVVPEYLQAQLAFDNRVKAQIREKVNAGGREVANGQILNQLAFVWAPINEQQTIVERLKTVDSLNRAANAQLQKLAKTKNGLMHDLLTGRVRVNVREPAAARPAERTSTLM